MNYTAMSKLMEERSNHKIKCICSHSITISPKTKFRICSWCGRKVYQDPKENFKKELLETIRRINEKSL